MKRILVAVLLVLTIFGISSLPVKVSAMSSWRGAENTWRGSVSPCNLNICGDYPQTVATLSLKEGMVTINAKGRVHIELSQVKYLASHKLAAHKTFQVFFGSFTHLANNGVLLGTIRTDSRGNFEGSIDTGNGVPFVFSPGVPVSGQFIFNEPNVRSEFVTGFNGHLWKESIIPCNLNICGDYPQNIATLSLKEGVVTINAKGRVHIELSQVKYLASHKLAAHKTFQVFIGSFTHLANNQILLGTIRTDSRGNFEGSIDTGNGVPFVFSAGVPVSGVFNFNEPNIRSEFVTGFSIPG